MRTDFDYPSQDLLGPVVFRPNFNEFENINSNQAWSLFFSAGQDDKTLGEQQEFGNLFNNILIAIGVTGVLWGVYFTGFFG